MKLTKTHLRQIIKEELQNILSEQYTKADIRKMTPQQAQQAFTGLGSDVDPRVYDDLLDRSQGIGSISSLDPETFDPVTKGLKWAREKFPKATAGAEVLGSVFSGVGETVALADLRGAETYEQEDELKDQFKQSVALGAVPGGRATKYAKGATVVADKAIEGAPKYAGK